MAGIEYSQVIYLISNVFRVFVLSLFLELFFSRKNLSHGIWFKRCILILYFILNSAIYLLINIPIVTVISNIALFFILTVPYKSSIWKRLFSILSLFVMGLICEGLVGRIALSIFTDINKARVITYILSNFLLYLMVILLKRIFPKSDDVLIPRIHWLLILIIPCLSSIADIVLILGGYKQWVNITVISSLFVINIAFFYLYSQIVLKYEIEFQNKALLQQNKAYNQQILMIRTAEVNLKKLRHDYKNHFIVIQKMLSEQRLKDLTDYFGTMEKNLESENNFVNTGNSSLDAILNYKLSTLYDLKVDVNINILIPENIDLDIFDTVVVLGNLLDNAITALQKTENGIFNLNMKYDKGLLFLHIKNSYVGVPRKIGHRFFTTKKESEMHGIGLSNVKRVVERYNGEIVISTEQNFFDVEIVIYI